MPSPVADLFADLEQALSALRVRWYLFGAQAALLYGAARLTADVDVTIFLPTTLTVEELTAGLAARRFRLRVTEKTFLERTKVIPILHQASGVPVDVVLGGPGLEEDFLSRTVIHEIEGTQVPVASPEDVIVMKVLAARPKDTEDVVAILASQADSLDLARVRRLLHDLEAALGQSDLMPILDGALARVRHEG